MTAEDLRDARRTLGEAWGFDRPLTLDEMGRLLRLRGDDVGASMRDYERGKTSISGPLSLAVDLLLASTPDPDEIARLMAGEAP